MNISSTTAKDSSTKIETAQNEASLKKTEEAKTTADNKEIAQKKEDTQKKESEFQKLVEAKEKEEKAPDSQPQLQQQQQNIINPENQNPNYVNTFAFDFGNMQAKNSLSMNFDTASISKDDAKFFADLVENKQFAVQESGGKTSLVKFADEIGPTYKTQQASKTLNALVEKAYKSGQSVRIDFDNNVSVIMKVDRKGKITAEFIPGDKAVEEYLRNNIRSLKQRFDDEAIGYNDIFYRQSRNNNQNKRKNKGE